MDKIYGIRPAGHSGNNHRVLSKDKTTYHNQILIHFPLENEINYLIMKNSINKKTGGTYRVLVFSQVPEMQCFCANLEKIKDVSQKFLQIPGRECRKNIL